MLRGRRGSWQDCFLLCLFWPFSTQRLGSLETQGCHLVTRETTHSFVWRKQSGMPRHIFFFLFSSLNLKQDWATQQIHSQSRCEWVVTWGFGKQLATKQRQWKLMWEIRPHIGTRALGSFHEFFSQKSGHPFVGIETYSLVESSTQLDHKDPTRLLCKKSLKKNAF